MAEPLREQVLSALVTLAKTMTGERPEGWGSYPAPLHVSREFRPATDVARYPALLLFGDSGSRIEQDDVNGAYVDHFNVIVLGYSNAAGGVLASTWSYRLWQDFHDVVEADVRDTQLSGLVSEVDFEGDYESDEGDTISKGYLAGFTQRVTFTCTPRTLSL